jgi:hypothetical protein
MISGNEYNFVANDTIVMPQRPWQQCMISRNEENCVANNTIAMAQRLWQ